MGLLEQVSEAIPTLDGYGLKRLRERFVGQVFEHLAYQWAVLENERYGLKMLSPGETLEFYKTRLFPNVKMISSAECLDVGSLQGITPPDGLAFGETGRIVGFYHYKAVGKVRNINHLVGMFKIDRREHSEFFDHCCRIYIVTLSDAVVDIFPGGKVVHGVLPFSRMEFYGLINDMWGCCLKGRDDLKEGILKC